MQDVTAAYAEYEPKSPQELPEVPVRVDEKCIDEAAEAINKAERPVILAGGGVSIAGANKELFGVCNKCPDTCYHNFNGHGCFPGTHELFME